MKDNALIPWKRIIFSATASVLITFLLTFAVALLCNYYVISMNIGKFCMFAVVFIAAFLGGFFVRSGERNLIYTLAASLLYFIILNVIGMFTGLEFSGDNTIYVLILIIVASVFNSLVKAAVK